MNNPTRIFDLLYYQNAKFPNVDIFGLKFDGSWNTFPTHEFIEKVNQISRALIAYGVQPDDKIGLISENRWEWNALDFAIQQVGAVVVAIYPNISESDYKFIFNDASIKLSFVSSDVLYSKIQSIKTETTALKDIYTINTYAQLPCWTDFLKLEANVNQSEVDSRAQAVKTDDLATLIYTSGTTGNPKGVMLSHKNLLADVMSSEYSFPVKAEQRALTFLPVCHAYERVFHYVYIFKGLTIYFAGSLETIGADMKEVKPHIFSAVPRVLEKVYEKIMAAGEELTGIKRKLFFWAVALGEQYELENRSAWYDFKLNIARKLIFSKWKEAIGGEVVGIASGSSALQQKLIKLYLAAGIPIFEGYGLTEAGPCLAVNCYKRGMKIGTVGVPLINIDIKLAEDGEILAKGDNIMLGYYKNEQATQEVLQDGWLHTGDIGQWIDGKYLKIIDRKKEMFKTSGGKYVVPQQIESKFVESPFIEQMMVIGENQKFPAAFIVPSYQNLKDWAKTNGFDIYNLDKEAFFKNPIILNKIKEEVDKMNIHFGNWEQIKRYELILEEFSIETGELTPTLKMKRKVILVKYQSLFEKIYSK
nr:long-chain fatty acid--CoA ligase [uncultured Flavobacterium sp.]